MPRLRYKPCINIVIYNLITSADTAMPTLQAVLGSTVPGSVGTQHTTNALKKAYYNIIDTAFTSHNVPLTTSLTPSSLLFATTMVGQTPYVVYSTAGDTLDMDGRDA